MWRTAGGSPDRSPGGTPPLVAQPDASPRASAGATRSARVSPSPGRTTKLANWPSLLPFCGPRPQSPLSRRRKPLAVLPGLFLGGKRPRTQRRSRTRSGWASRGGALRAGSDSSDDSSVRAASSVSPRLHLRALEMKTYVILLAPVFGQATGGNQNFKYFAYP